MNAVCRFFPLLLSGGMAWQLVVAEVATDGTLGPALDLTGPDYAITANLGRQAGPNLFHSFQVFSIQQGESATWLQWYPPCHLQLVAEQAQGAGLDCLEPKRCVDR